MLTISLLASAKLPTGNIVYHLVLRLFWFILDQNLYLRLCSIFYRAHILARRLILSPKQTRLAVANSGGLKIPQTPQLLTIIGLVN